MKTIFSHLSPEERLAAIQALSEGEETLTYTKPLSREEMDEYRENLTDEMIKARSLEEQFAQQKAAHKERIDPVNRGIAELLGIIRAKAIEVREECFLVPNYEAGMMEFYNANGELVDSRRLRPEERQTTIKQLNQAI